MEEFLFSLARADLILPGQVAGDSQGAIMAAKLHRLLEFSMAVTMRYAYAQIEQGAHMTSIGESLAGPDVCSPRQYLLFAMPYERQVVESLAADDIRIALHICGDTTRILGPRLATGADALELDHAREDSKAGGKLQGKRARSSRWKVRW
jgi:uroporphyrinogen-III decarboxylase